MTNNITDLRIAMLRDKLSKALAPSFLDIIDEGWQHIGHAEEGSGHFAVRIASPCFIEEDPERRKKNKSLLECHRLVYSALGSIVGTEIHALRIEIIPAD